jgi:uncharacterized protein YfaT (DUF1175 family)
MRRRQPLPIEATIFPTSMIADGRNLAALTVQRPGGEPAQGPVRITLAGHAQVATVELVTESKNGWRAYIRAGVQPGRITLRADAPGFLPAAVELSTSLETTDRASDGTPDFLRLDQEHDQLTFRRWFTFLAEAQYFQTAAERPAEIKDCAALIRYAYREALRLHDSSWTTDARLPILPALESVAKYQYPRTPMGASLFRVRPGPFLPSDLADGSFSQFADAQTLKCLNTHFITRDLSRALPGDLLFYRQPTEHMPFHGMIFVGRSQIGTDSASYVLYHTGPADSDPGEIKRLRTDELISYPEPQWRPLGPNSSFLGVYRWNILRKAD